MPDALIDAHADPGSFRDPSGYVFLAGDRVLRTVNDCAAEHFDFVQTSGFLDSPEVRDWVIEARRVARDELGPLAASAHYLVEHPRVPFISYPYEWCFGALKAAALLQLDLHIRALDRGITMSDASAYNIQFIGARPIFIDLLSFRRYRPGEYWAGQQQFCEQFLNPLLLRAVLGVAHNAWYRGNLEGIPTIELARLLPWRRFLSWVVLTHVFLNARLQRAQFKGERKLPRKSPARGLALGSFRAMLVQLRNYVARLEPAGAKATAWGDYSVTHSYGAEDQAAKMDFVEKFIADVRPNMLWDLGCNTGDYALLSLKAGARRVIGFDFDQLALETAFRRASAQRLDFLPLFFDAVNPSPDQGWRQAERRGLRQRAKADAVLALAFEHHLAIGRNTPIGQLLEWLVGLAPRGVIEFVPKSDPMIQIMLAHREDIFGDYTEETFTRALASHARIVRADTVSSTGRKLFWFDRA
jgi:ribosomal protein L11 methylase PrmA